MGNQTWSWRIGAAELELERHSWYWSWK